MDVVSVKPLSTGADGTWGAVRPPRCYIKCFERLKGSRGSKEERSCGGCLSVSPGI